MFDSFVSSHSLPGFRLKQLYKAYYNDAVTSYTEISTLPKLLREQLEQEVLFSRLSVDISQTSADGNTIKVLFTRSADGQKIESVLMKHKDGRNTVCVSCMVGCPVNCTFCATGKMGFRGSLSAEEIIDQILYFKRLLKQKGEDVTNVVYMGMGEPMLNLAEVEKSIQILNSPDKIGLGIRHITVSTSGYIPQFKKFVANGYRGRVAISLHAPNQELRSQLMPVARAFHLQDLMTMLDEYVALTNKRVTYEYVMIDQVNDQAEHAYDLVNLLKGRLAHINLIPYNPIPHTTFKRSPRDSIQKFSEILTTEGINHTVRVTMGDDIAAACGQLIDYAPTVPVVTALARL